MEGVAPDAVGSISLLGHGGSGKTTLAEGILYIARALDRRGKVEDGTSALDSDPEEQRRRMSLSLAVGSLSHGGRRLYLCDSPGYPDFWGDQMAAMHAADTGLLVVDAASVAEVGAELAWQRMSRSGLPRIVFVNKMDRPEIDPAAVVKRLRDQFGDRLAALTWPLPKGMTLEVWSGRVVDADGAVSEERSEQAESLLRELSERAAEGDDDALEEYLEQGELSRESLMRALPGAIRTGALVPVLYGSAHTLSGLHSLLAALCSFSPGPTDKEEGELRFVTDPTADVALRVFKTTADPHVGRLSVFRVLSGTLQADSHLVNAMNLKEERIGQIYRLRGKHQDPVPELVPGEIGAVAKLQHTVTGEILVSRSPASPIALEPVAEPVFRMALHALSAADEDRLSSALHRLMEEDPTLRLEHSEGHETIIAGQGEMQMEVLHEHLRHKFSVAVDMVLPEVPYRETIRGNVRVEGRHKKQTGGHGQYGHVWLELSPGEREFEFVDKVFGGSVPLQYRSAVEKGVVEAMQSGVVAGYPLIGVRCALVDGSSHPVDSSEMAFKLAGALALRTGVAQARPVLLEPIDELRVECPESLMGDVIALINRRRGRVQGMESEAGVSVVRALAPQAELQRFATDLRSVTGGRGTFHQSFAHYDEVPSHVAQQIILRRKEHVH